MATNEEIQAQIDQLEAALTDLALGKSASSVGFDGRSVTYTPANANGIRARIRELNAKLGVLPRRSFTPNF